MKTCLKVGFVTALWALACVCSANAANGERAEVTSRADQLRVLQQLSVLASEVTLDRSVLLAKHGRHVSDSAAEMADLNIEGRIDLGSQTIGNVTITTSADPGLRADPNLVMRLSGGCIERQIGKDAFAPLEVYWASPGGSPEPLIGFKHVADGHDVILFFDAFGEQCLTGVRSEVPLRQ